VSRGHGKAQRFILERLQRHAEIEGSPEVAFMPVGSLAGMYARQEGVPNSASLHRSFRRAAVALGEADELTVVYEDVPTSADWGADPSTARRAMCVGLPCFSYAVEPILLAAILNGVGPTA
jgi:hypothetical protein